MGREVVGLDLSEPMLRIARAKGGAATFLHGDMMEVRLEQRFEAVIALHLPTEQALRTPAHDRPLARTGDITLTMPRIEQAPPRFDYYAEYRTPEGVSVERLTYWLGPVDAPGLKRRTRPFGPGTEMHLLRRDRSAPTGARH